MDHFNPIRQVGASTHEPELVGALPWRLNRKGDRRLLLVTSPIRGWTIPAGSVSTELGPARSAARHAFEQAGAIGDIDGEPGGSYLCLPLAEDRSLLPRRARLFALRVRGTLAHWRESGSRQRRWISAREVTAWISEPSLADLVAEWIATAEAASLLSHQPEVPA